MLTLLRVLFGFIIACLVAGVTMVFFVVTPADIAALPAEARPGRLADAGELALLAATHSAIFAAPFALIANVAAEWARIRSFIYYVIVGLLIGLGGFASYYLNEVPGQDSILNNYALRAFVTVGILGGLAYWLFAGRRAGGRRADPPAKAPADATPEPVAS